LYKTTLRQEDSNDNCKQKKITYILISDLKQLNKL